ncbi:MAG: thioredoxin domain-containing protein [bacterium]|nr:thioredoxin domain-containing protein [bacterium]
MKKRLLLALILSFPMNSCNGDPKKEQADNMSVDTEHKHTNHLIDENSPYLLSHAHNPVNWYPWGEEALAKAKAEDKPIFLSIGYAACHWCHVMERESFENEEIAALMNESFVSIKVDREQRPDLDEIYMTFTQAITGHGGWPMSVFLTPELKPFYAGTYFPPEDQYGRPGFKSLLSQIQQAYASDKSGIMEAAKKMFVEVSSRVNSVSGSASLDRKVIGRGAESLMRGFDHTYGGFGQAPKFPHTMELSLFLRYYKAENDPRFLQATEQALKGMAYGGIYDHLGGGFARYSTDERWLVPHFEKMIYDNALLVRTYAEAFQITGNELYRTTIRETLDFMLRELHHSNGGFYSALDADSEGEEGKFYVWSQEEIEAVLGKQEAAAFIRYYNVSSTGNFEGYNILHLTSASDQVRQEAGDGFDNYIAESKRKLFEARSKRVRPLTDDKILTSWNGLALTALCRGYQITGDDKYLEAARKNASFVSETMFENNRLTHSYREGRRSEGEFLEDYGYYLYGVLDLFESDGNKAWLDFAVTLADRAVVLFADDDGKLYLRPDGETDLIYRPKEQTDGALPNSSSYLIHSLLRLNRITENPDYLETGQKFLRALSGTINQYPSGMTSALFALDYHLGDKLEIVIIGSGPEKQEMLNEIYRRYLPTKMVALSDSGDESVSPLFKGRKAKSGEVVAYVCVNSACQLPVNNVRELKVQLSRL